MDPIVISIGNILREEETRYKPENITEIASLGGVALYMLVFVSYWYKGELTFYNNTNNMSELDVNINI